MQPRVPVAFEVLQVVRDGRPLREVVYQRLRGEHGSQKLLDCDVPFDLGACAGITVIIGRLKETAVAKIKWLAGQLTLSVTGADDELAKLSSDSSRATKNCFPTSPSWKSRAPTFAMEW